MNTIENIESNLECEEDKKKAFKIIRSVIVAFLVIGFFSFINKKTIEQKEELINAFLNNKELICRDKIVSLNNGYKLEKNKKFFISDGTNIFNVKQCSLR